MVPRGLRLAVARKALKEWKVLGLSLRSEDVEAFVVQEEATFEPYAVTCLRRRCEAQQAAPGSLLAENKGSRPSSLWGWQRRARYPNSYPSWGRYQPARSGTTAVAPQFTTTLRGTRRHFRAGLADPRVAFTELATHDGLRSPSTFGNAVQPWNPKCPGPLRVPVRRCQPTPYASTRGHVQRGPPNTQRPLGPRKMSRPGSHKTMLRRTMMWREALRRLRKGRQGGGACS